MLSVIRLSALLFFLWMTPGYASGSAAVVRLATNLGDILVTVDQTRAPISAANFLRYVRAGYYDGTIFHRVIPGFMIQGGGFDSQMRKKATRAPIRNEADNGLRNVVGSIAMARTSDPHSATAQFFINIADNTFLDHRSRTPNGWGYAVFGRVTAGMDVIERIARTATTTRNGYRDVPRTPVIIQRATVVAPVTPPNSN